MVQDLYVLMITAAVVSIVFKFLKQPVVLGYIVAGVLVGPHLFGETLVNADNVKSWGDVVQLTGKRGAYKDSPQMVNGTCELLHAVTPVTIAEFLTMPDDKNTYYMVTGTISSLLGSNGKENDYGNLYITDGTNELYVYGTYSGWNAQGDARKFFIADNGIEVGDEITIIGYKDTYKELVELCQGVCFSFTKPGLIPTNARPNAE